MNIALIKRMKILNTRWIFSVKNQIISALKHKEKTFHSLHSLNSILEFPDFFNLNIKVNHNRQVEGLHLKH